MARFEENPDWHVVVDECSREALSNVVAQVHEMASRIAPVDTGFLKSRLYSQVDVDGKSGVVGDDADYARWVEEGHRVPSTGTVVPPQPYLRTSLNSARVEGSGP